MTLPGTPAACPFTPLGIALRSARDRRGLSQADLTRSLDWPRNRLVSVERGAMDLTAEQLADVIKVLDPTTEEGDELVDAWSLSTKVFTFVPIHRGIAKAMGVLAYHGEDLTPAALREIIEVARPRRAGRTAS